MNPDRTLHGFKIPKSIETSNRMSNPMITLYTVGTPNGHKVSIALKLLGLAFNVHQINFSKLEQKEEWFLKINPNGRIPAIVDHSNGDFPVFESGAILLYLAEHHDPNHLLLPVDPKKKSVAIQWLMWQMGGLGPMQGQANHFYRYAPEKIPYGIKRYQDETLRLYRVMERGLAESDFLAGEKISVADISCFSWVASHEWAGLSLSETPLVEKWLHRMAAIDAVREGMDVPTKNSLIERNFKVEQSSAQKVASEASKWIMQGQGSKV
ncbi:putative glutathione S-transferase [Zopfochytrium polystomum]|nr:putative glutathione S-transferase [Zopfochytrium polystomum]